MPRRKFGDLLGDIIEYSATARRLADDGGFSVYASQPERKLAIERSLQVVGEALNQAVSLRSQFAWQISDASEIIAFRHLLTHHYYNISERVVWGIIIDDLALLERQVASVIVRLNFQDQMEKNDVEP